MTQKELAKLTGLSLRSVKSALKKLVNEGQVTEKLLLIDVRRKKYSAEVTKK